MYAFNLCGPKCEGENSKTQLSLDSTNSHHWAEICHNEWLYTLKNIPNRFFCRQKDDNLKTIQSEIVQICLICLHLFYFYFAVVKTEIDYLRFDYQDSILYLEFFTYYFLTEENLETKPKTSYNTAKALCPTVVKL